MALGDFLIDLVGTFMLLLILTIIYYLSEKSGMAEHIWKEKGNHLRLKEAAHMLDYVDLLSKPSTEMNTIW